MVLISSTKYACETCIKGHRSSTCKHTDRALFEIKKKGRPVTQCEHCRELRKTKQVHVKCLCELKVTSTAPLAPGAGKKANSQVPESAAFPFGLPEALEASVALQLSSEGSSDSDYGGPCTCKAGGNCNCWTPRTSAPRSRRKGSREHHGDQVADLNRIEYNPPKPNPSPINSARTPSHILARISELRPVLPRPVLPRPPMNKEGGLSGPLHVPSSGVAHGRHHHENMFFSPYGRAYDYARGSHEQLPSDHELTQQVLRPSDLSEASLPNDQSYANQLLQIASSWMPTSESAAQFSSLCGCGDGCSCLGCVQHNAGVVSLNAPPDTSFQFCTNPGACTSCLSCNIISVPEFLPSDTVLSIHDSQSIDEWLRQVAALPTPVPVPAAPIPDQTPLETTGYQAPSWNPFQLPGLSESDRLPVLGRGCCDGQCKCPPGLCRCEYQDNQDEPNRLTPGERMSHCCGKMDVRADFPHNELNFTASANPRPLRVVEQRDVSAHTGGFLRVPQIGRSRSSSVSSQSSAGQMSIGNTGHCGPIPNARVRVATRMSPLSFPITPSRSPIIGEPDSAYARSNPDSDLSLDDGYSQYDPSLDEIQLS